jgi:hypothetical protein
VGDQSVRQRGVEEHHRAACLENPEVTRDDLPVVLRHHHRDHLIGAGEKRRNGRGNVFGARVELREGQ